MKTICLYFELHQPLAFKRYRFFDIGTDHYYYDDYTNENNILDVVNKSYRPALNALLEMITLSEGYFRVALSISGVTLNQLEMHAPDIIELLKELGKTGKCEFLAETYSHGLSSLIDEEAFKEEVLRHAAKINQLLNQKPTVFRNTELVYSDAIGGFVSNMGFKGMLTEGAKHVLGWKSPHYVYHSSEQPKFKLLLRDYKLSDDISLRFSNSEWSEYPLYGEKFISWIAALPEDQQLVNIFMPLETFGLYQPLYSNILEFMKALPRCAKEQGVSFSTPTDVMSKMRSVSVLNAPDTISWTNEERETSSWLGNVLQREAFGKLYSIAMRVRMCKDKRIKQDWDNLQTSNHFRYMTTKSNKLAFGIGNYTSPFDAFTNYMNILGDFIHQVNAQFPESIDDEELDSLTTTVNNQEKLINKLNKQIATLETELSNSKPTPVVKEKTKTVRKKKGE